MPEYWDKQPNESGLAFDAFVIYRDLGVRRTYDAAWREHQARMGRERAGRAPGLWRNWAKDHHWKDRATAFDVRGQDVANAAREETIATEVKAQTREQILADRRLDQSELEWKLRGELVAKAREMLAAKLYRTKAIQNGQVIEIAPVKWSMYTAVQMLELAAKLGRTSAKMPLEAVGDAAPELQDLFFTTSGQTAAALPDGVIPPMPADVLEKPQIASTGDATGDARLVQPTKPPRPE